MSHSVKKGSLNQTQHDVELPSVTFMQGVRHLLRVPVQRLMYLLNWIVTLYVSCQFKVQRWKTESHSSLSADLETIFVGDCSEVDYLVNILGGEKRSMERRQSSFKYDATFEHFQCVEPTGPAPKVPHPQMDFIRNRNERQHCPIVFERIWLDSHLETNWEIEMNQ